MEGSRSSCASRRNETKLRFPCRHLGLIYNCQEGNMTLDSATNTTTMTNTTTTTTPRTTARSLRKRMSIRERGDPLLSVLLVVSLACLSFIPGFVTGLQCYECLSLHCKSGVVCESIKGSIAKAFVPNSHYIHFDPRIICPGPEVPSNGSEWEAVTFNCSRSDSLCLEAPVEVISSFDGLRDGRKLDLSSEMISLGFLRGCASRRGLGELPGRTISVRKIYMDNETIEEELERMDPHNRFRDGYKITRIHFHEIYVDHGTANATRCYYDDCNNKKKLRIRSGAAAPSGIITYQHYFSSLLVFFYYALGWCL